MFTEALSRGSRVGERYSSGVPRDKSILFLTGRSDIREDVKRDFPKAVVIPINPNRNDIRNYVKMRLDRDSEPEAMSNDLRVDIVRVILEKISNV